MGVACCLADAGRRGLGGAKPPPQGFEAFFQKKPYHAVVVLAAVGVGPS